MLLFNLKKTSFFNNKRKHDSCEECYIYLSLYYHATVQIILMGWGGVGVLWLLEFILVGWGGWGDILLLCICTLPSHQYNLECCKNFWPKISAPSKVKDETNSSPKPEVEGIRLVWSMCLPVSEHCYGFKMIM